MFGRRVAFAIVLLAAPAGAATKEEIAAAVNRDPCALVVDGWKTIGAMTAASRCASGYSVAEPSASACHGPRPIAWTCTTCEATPQPACSTDETGTAKLGGSVKVGDESYVVTGTASYAATIHFDVTQSRISAGPGSAEESAFTYYAEIADASVTKQSLAGGTATVETPDGKVTVPMPSGVDCGFRDPLRMARSVEIEKRSCDSPKYESRSSNKMELGLGVGGSLPFGKIDGGTNSIDLGDSYGAAVPVQLDAGYRSAGGISIGLGVGIAPASVTSSSCPSGLSCSAYILHTRVEGKWHFAPIAIVEPWIGLGVGWEWAHNASSASGTNAGDTLSGFELANLMCGAELRLADAWSIGPFASVSFGEYTSTSNGSIPDKAFHEWLTLGVRGAYGIAVP